MVIKIIEIGHLIRHSHRHVWGIRRKMFNKGNQAVVRIYSTTNVDNVLEPVAQPVPEHRCVTRVVF